MFTGIITAFLTVIPAKAGIHWHGACGNGEGWR